MARRFSKAAFSAEYLLDRICGITSVTPRERELVLSLNERAEVFEPGAHINASTEMPMSPIVLVSGWACRCAMLSSGKSRLLSIFIPGEIIGGGVEQRPLDLVNVVAITQVKTISALPAIEAIRLDKENYENLAGAIDRLVKDEEQRLIDQMVRIGSQSALERAAAFIYDLYKRCDTIGFVSDGRFSMPLTQEMLADVLGLSAVHVNRIVRKLKSDDIIAYSAGVFTIRDLDRLRMMADSYSQEPVAGQVELAELPLRGA